MSTIHTLLAGAAIAVATVGAADAQTRRSETRAGMASGQEVSRGRGPDRVARARGPSGTIGWNTPNASGNLGGPGAGGGGGNTN